MYFNSQLSAKFKFNDFKKCLQKLSSINIRSKKTYLECYRKLLQGLKGATTKHIFAALWSRWKSAVNKGIAVVFKVRNIVFNKSNENLKTRREYKIFVNERKFVVAAIFIKSFNTIMQLIQKILNMGGQKKKHAR